MASKDPRLEEAEQDFETLTKFLRNEPKVKKTKRIERLMGYVKLYTTYAYGAIQDCCAMYRLKKNRYPDTDIIKILEAKLRDTGPLLPKGKTLFPS